MNLTKRFKRAASMMTITDGGELVSGEETYPQGSGSQEYQQPQEVPNSHTENTAETVKEQVRNDSKANNYNLQWCVQEIL